MAGSGDHRDMATLPEDVPAPISRTGSVAYGDEWIAPDGYHLCTHG
jgi:hypothetical protein